MEKYSLSSSRSHHDGTYHVCMYSYSIYSGTCGQICAGIPISASKTVSWRTVTFPAGVFQTGDCSTPVRSHMP